MGARSGRLNRWIDQLQADQPPSVPPADAGESELAAAAALSGLRLGADEPDPVFLAGLCAAGAGGRRPSGGSVDRVSLTLRIILITCLHETDHSSSSLHISWLGLC